MQSRISYLDQQRAKAKAADKTRKEKARKRRVSGKKAKESFLTLTDYIYQQSEQAVKKGVKAGKRVVKKVKKLKKK